MKKKDKERFDKLKRIGCIACYKKGRFTDSYLDVKDLVVIWKDYLDQFDDLLKSNDFCSDYTCTC